MSAPMVYIRFSTMIVFLQLIISYVSGVSVSSWLRYLFDSESTVAPLELGKYGFLRRFALGFTPGIFHTYFCPSIGYKKNRFLIIQFDGQFLYNLHKLVLREKRAVYFYDFSDVWIATRTAVKNDFFCKKIQRSFRTKCCKRLPDVEFCDTAPNHDVELLSSIFITPEMLKFTTRYFWCYKTREHLIHNPKDKESSKEFNEICPNPCKREPCRSKFGVIDEKCIRPVGAMFDFEFNCKCKESMTWSMNSEMCHAVSKCSQEGTVSCSPEGTESCLILPESFKCKCKPEFMGQSCKRRRNACYSRYEETSKIGNTMCNTIQGNRCIPIISSDEFVCNCTSLWEHDPSLEDSNCLQPVDNCEYQNCLNNGTCSSSPDLAVTACDCKGSRRRPTHIGANCQFPVIQWNNWGEYSECRPTCGFQRYRLRRRTCPQGFGQCVGEEESVEACGEKICPTIGESDFEAPIIHKMSALFVCAIAVGLQIGGSYALWHFCVVQRALVKKVREKMVKKIKELKKRFKRADTTEDSQAAKLLKTIKRDGREQ